MLFAPVAALCIATVHVDHQESFQEGTAVHSVYSAHVINAKGCDAKAGERLYFAAPGGVVGDFESRVNGLNIDVGSEALVHLTDATTSLGVPFVLQASQQKLAMASDMAFMCTRVPGMGPSLFWRNRKVVMQPSLSPDSMISQNDLSDAMQWAARQWSQNHGADFTFEIGDPTSQRWVGFDWTLRQPNANIVTVRARTRQDFYGEWAYRANVVAMTTVTFVHSTGEIVDADIEINENLYSFDDCLSRRDHCFNRYDLANTLTHEFGHALGLDHPDPSHKRSEFAAMYANCSPGELSKRWLSEDDIGGLRFLYPVGEASGDCFYEQRRPQSQVAIFADTGCAQTKTTHWWALVLALMMLVLKGGRLNWKRCFLAESW